MDTSDPRCWHRRGDHSAARESGKQECRHPESLLLGRVRSGRVSKRGAHPWRGRNGGHARREGNLTGRIVPRAAGRSSIASFLRKIKLGSLATAGRDVEDRVHHCAVGLPSPPALLCRRQERCDQRPFPIGQIAWISRRLPAMLNASGASPGHTILRSSGRSQRITTR